jgi:hypothetical protein
MSDTARVRAWRQRLKDSGLVPMTIWVKAATTAALVGSYPPCVWSRYRTEL